MRACGLHLFPLACGRWFLLRKQVAYPLSQFARRTLAGAPLSAPISCAWPRAAALTTAATAAVDPEAEAEREAEPKPEEEQEKSVVARGVRIAEQTSH